MDEVVMSETSPRPPRRRIRPHHVVLGLFTLIVAAGAWWYWSGSQRMTLAVGSSAHAVAFSPDGTVLATGGALTDWPRESNCIIRLWDVATGRQVANWTTRGSSISHLDFDPDGKTLTSTANISNDRLPKYEVRVWDLTTFKEVGSAKLADVSKGFPLTSPTGKVVATPRGTGVLAVCDAGTGEELYRVQADRKQLNCAAFSADGTLIATGGGDTSGGGPSPLWWMNGHLRIWDVHTGRLLVTYNRHSAPIEGIAFSPDGRFVASASLDGSVKVWAVLGR